MFFKMPNFPIGLDISDSSLKFVQLGKSGKKILVKSFGKIALEDGIIENGQIKDTELFSSKVVELLENPKFGKVSSKRIVVCLPEPKTFIKVIKISKDKKIIQKIIENELKKHIPISIEDVYYDWQVIARDDKERKILIGVSPKVFVDQYIKAFDMARLSLVATEIESMSISRCIIQREFQKSSEQSKNYGIIDIGANRSSMFIYSKGAILFNVSIPLSGHKITEKISKELSIDKKHAEAAKIICGIDKTKCGGIVESKISKLIQKLLLRINQVLEFHDENFYEFGKIDEIIISGGGANIKNLDKEIEKFTNIKTLVADPSINIDIVPTSVQEKMKETYRLPQGKNSLSKGFSITQNISLTYCTAIGLALREIFIEKL